MRLLIWVEPSTHFLSTWALGICLPSSRSCVQEVDGLSLARFLWAQAVKVHGFCLQGLERGSKSWERQEYSSNMIGTCLPGSTDSYIPALFFGFPGWGAYFGPFMFGSRGL